MIRVYDKYNNYKYDVKKKEVFLFCSKKLSNYIFLYILQRIFRFYYTYLVKYDV